VSGGPEPCPGVEGGCTQLLCPYPDEHDAVARGEFGEAFCNDMLKLTTSRWRRFVEGPLAPWQRDARDLPEFWRHMELRAQGLRHEQ
jgi:hypothetical protein